MKEYKFRIRMDVELDGTGDNYEDAFYNTLVKLEEQLVMENRTMEQWFWDNADIKFKRKSSKRWRRY